MKRNNKGNSKSPPSSNNDTTAGKQRAANSMEAAANKEAKKKAPEQRMNDFDSFRTVASITLITPFVLFVMELLPSTRNHHLVMGSIAALIMMVVFVYCYFLFKRSAIENKLLGATMLFVVWTASTSTFISLSMLNFTNLGRFYIETGEKYFASTYGFFCLFWDGSFHLLIQSVIVFSILTNRPYKYFLLIWCGSILNSLLPFFLGAATGPFSDQFQFAMSLNIPYLFFPLAICFQTIYSNPKHGRVCGEQVSENSNARSLLMHGFLLFYHFAAVVVHMYRAIFVMGSKMPMAILFVSQVDAILKQNSNHDLLSSHSFLNTQAMQSFFFLNLFHVFAFHEVGSRLVFNSRGPALGGCFPEVSSIVLGVYLQCEFCWIGK